MGARATLGYSFGKGSYVGSSPTPSTESRSVPTVTRVTRKVTIMSEVSTQPEVVVTEWVFDPATVVADVTEARVAKVTARAAIKAAFKVAIKAKDFALVAELDALDDAVSAIRSAKANVGPTAEDYADAIKVRVQSLMVAANRLASGTYVPRDVPKEIREEVAGILNAWRKEESPVVPEVPTKLGEQVHDWVTRNVVQRSNLDEHFAHIVAGQARTASGQPFPFDPTDTDRVYGYSEICAARTDAYPAGIESAGRVSARFVKVGDRASKAPTGWEYATTAKGSHGCKFVGQVPVAEGDDEA